MATQGREPGIETLGRPGDLTDPDILRQEPPQAADQRGELGFVVSTVARVRQRQCLGGDVGMGDLTGGMHTAIGAPGPENPDRRPENRRQRIFDDAGDGPVALLYRPAGEIRTVVGDIEPEPDYLRTRQTSPR